MADEAILALPERAWPKAEPSSAVHADASDESASIAVSDALAGATAAPVASTPTTPATPPSTPPASLAPVAAPIPTRPDVSDFDHIFSAPDLTFIEPEEDLFPWEAASDAKPGAVATPPAAPIGSAGVGAVSAAFPATPPSAPSSQAPKPARNAEPTRISVDGPRGIAEGTNNPVSTYLARAPKIRLTFSGAAAAIMTVTIGLGFVEALLSDHIGIVTAVLSVATALAATWLVSDRDRTAPALLLPVSWLVCALLPGQLTAPPTGSVALKQVVVVLGVLGENAIAIIVGTLACYILARLRPRLVTNPLA